MAHAFLDADNGEESTGKEWEYDYLPVLTMLLLVDRC